MYNHDARSHEVAVARNQIRAYAIHLEIELRYIRQNADSHAPVTALESLDKALVLYEEIKKECPQAPTDLVMQRELRTKIRTAQDDVQTGIRLLIPTPPPYKIRSIDTYLSELEKACKIIEGEETPSQLTS